MGSGGSSEMVGTTCFVVSKLTDDRLLIVLMEQFPAINFENDLQRRVV